MKKRFTLLASGLLGIALATVNLSDSTAGPAVFQDPGPVIAIKKISVARQRDGTGFVDLTAGGKGARIESRDHSLYNEYLKNHYSGGSLDWFQIPADAAGKVMLRSLGSFGGQVCKSIKVSKLPNGPGLAGPNLAIKESVIGGLGSNAESLHPNLNCEDPALFDEQGVGTLPVLCPRLDEARRLYEPAQPPPYSQTQPHVGFVGNAMLKAATYDAFLDAKNNPPQDKIYNTAVYSSFDCENTLLIERVATRYDWEDDGLLLGVDKADGTAYFDRTGGAYANFHYAVMPCNDSFDNQYQRLTDYLDNTPSNGSPGSKARLVNDLMRCAHQNCSDLKEKAYHALQFFLHLGWDGLGSVDTHGNEINLDEINQADERPALKLHSLLPGPFWTKDDEGYAQCEWLDSAGLAPNQALNYKNFAIWDWDGRPETCVAVLLWEGDGASTSVSRDATIGKHDIADDFIGYFKVRKADTAGKKFVTTNLSGDLTMTFATGNTTCRN